MSNHQDMSRRQGRTQASASNRLGQLTAQGHQVNMEAGPDQVTITLTRREGYAHHITIKPENLPDHARATAAFNTYPQSVMIAYALHAIADWSAEVDQRSVGACLGCGKDGAAANYNQQTSLYDWFCHTCFYGQYPEAI